MRVMRWITPLLTALLLGCGSGTKDFTATNSAQQLIKNGAATTLALASGALVTFPANTFSEDVTVMFADVLQNKDGETTYYPTAAPQVDDLIAGAVVNTPAGTVLQREILLTFAIREGATVTPGDQYALYRFDLQEDNESSTVSHWNRWGNRYATISSSGNIATVTLPTLDFIGFVGSLALFRGLTVPTPLAEVDPGTSTWIEGYTIDKNGNGVAMDVGLYVVVGTKLYPVDILNNDRRVPNLPDPRDDSLMIVKANTINSDSDGHFLMYLPENLVGQFVGLEFGHESAAYDTQSKFDLLFPTVTLGSSADIAAVMLNKANILDEDTENFVVRFGSNKLVTRAVNGSN